MTFDFINIQKNPYCIFDSSLVVVGLQLFKRDPKNKTKQKKIFYQTCMQSWQVVLCIWNRRTPPGSRWHSPRFNSGSPSHTTVIVWHDGLHTYQSSCEVGRWSSVFGIMELHLVADGFPQGPILSPLHNILHNLWHDGLCTYQSSMQS